MQHGKKTVKLGRTTSHRDAMLANMAASLFLHEKITTTTPKAKALRPLVDRLITTAKQGTLASQRQVARTVRDKEAIKKLFREIVPKLDDRNSGYSRVVKAGFRRGDGAELAVIELLIERPVEVTEKKKEGRVKRLTGKLKKSPKAESKKKSGKRTETKAKADEVEETEVAEEPETSEAETDSAEEKSPGEDS